MSFEDVVKFVIEPFIFCIGGHVLKNLVLLQSSNVAGGTLPLLIALVIISACVCRRPS